MKIKNLLQGALKGRTLEMDTIEFDNLTEVQSLELIKLLMEMDVLMAQVENLKKQEINE